MKLEQKIEILEIENKDLRAEINLLKNEMSSISAGNIKELNSILQTAIDDYKKMLSDCYDYKFRYMDLCKELEDIKVKYTKKFKRYFRDIG